MKEVLPQNLIRKQWVVNYISNFINNNVFTCTNSKLLIFFLGQVVGDLSFCFRFSAGSLSNIYRNSGYLFFNKILFHIDNSSKHEHNFLVMVYAEIYI